MSSGMAIGRRVAAVIKHLKIYPIDYEVAYDVQGVLRYSLAAGRIVSWEPVNAIRPLDDAALGFRLGARTGSAS